MTTWLSRSLLLLIVSACAAVALAGRAQAEPPGPNHPCMLMSADVTLSVPLDGPWMWAGSGTTFYADRILCPWLVVDFWMPAGPGEMGLGAKPTTPCMTSVQMLMYVRPPFSTTFSLWDGDTMGPSMKCDYDPSIAHGTSLTPGFFGIRRWRLLARAWSHPPLSPKVPAPVFGWGLAMSH